MRRVSRFRLLAVAVLAMVALVAGAASLALSGSGDDRPAAGATPTDLGTPTDVAAGVDAPAGVVSTVGRLTQDGIARSYLVLAPSSPAPSTPLVVGLHGRNATPGEEATRDQLLPYVASGQAVVVYPVGYNQAWNDDDGCCGLAVAERLDDVTFVGKVVDAVRAQLGLTGPTDLVGFSNGGRLAYAVGCRDARRYDAIATVAAAPPTTDCPDASLPLPVFAGVTLDDPELPTSEGAEPAATVIADIATTWTTRNACLGDPTTTSAGQATVRVWTACAAGSVVQTVTWRSGGHIWPQAVDVGSPDAADLVWSFLSGVHLRAGV